MPIETHLTDPNGAVQRVDGKGFAYTIPSLVPPMLAANNYKIYRSYFKTSAGVSSMLVDGSVTNVDYYVGPHPTRDRYIYTVSIQIADGASDLSKFGGIAALANGVLFFYEDVTETITIHEGLKTNGHLVRLAGGKPSFGDAATAFQFPNIGPPGVPVIGYMPNIDIASQFGLPIPLRAGSLQRLVLRVRDDITAPDQFDAIAYGIERVPD